MSITAGEAYVSVSVDNSELVKGLNESSSLIRNSARRIETLEKTLTPKVGVIGVGALTRSLGRVEQSLEKTAKKAQMAAAAIGGFAGGLAFRLGGAVKNTLGKLTNFADGFQKAALRTGFSAQTLSEYAYAAELSGASLADVERGAKAMAARLNDAAVKGGESAEVFNRLGISAQELLRLSPEQQFETLANAVAGIQNPTERAAVAMKIFGEAGTGLLPLFEAGPEGMAKMRREANELGVTVSDSAANIGAEYSDAITRAKTAFTGLATSIVGQLAPTVTKVATKLSEWVALVTKLLRAHPEIARALALTATCAAAALAAISGMARVVSTVRTGIRGVQAAIAAISAHPVVALTAAVVALGAAVASYYTVKNGLSKRSWSEEAQNALDAGDAIRSQDEERLRRLEELRDKQSLSKMEISEAVRLASELNSRYGDVGISVDAVTGKIKIAANAQDELNKKMLEARKKELEAAVEEAEQNADYNTVAKKVASETEVSLYDYKEGMGGWYNAAGGMVGLSKDERKMMALQGNADYEKKVRAEFDKAKAKAESLRTQLAALNEQEAATANAATDGGAPDSASAPLAPSDSATSRSDFDHARDGLGSYLDAAKVEKDKESLNEYDRMRYDIDRDAEEQKRRLREAAGDNPEFKDALDEAIRQIDDAVASRKSIVDARQKRDEQAKDDAQKEKENAEKQANADRRKNAEDAWFDKFATPEKKVAAAQKELQTAQKELRAARRKGSDEAIAAALEKIVKSQNDLERASSSLEKAYDFSVDPIEDAVEPINAQMKSVGTFSTFQAQAWGAGDYQKKLYDQSREQTTLLRRLVQNAGNAQAVFS